MAYVLSPDVTVIQATSKADTNLKAENVRTCNTIEWMGIARCGEIKICPGRKTY